HRAREQRSRARICFGLTERAANHSPRIVRQPLVRKQRTRGDVQPYQIGVQLFAHPHEGLREASAELCSEQACDLEHRAERKNLGRLKGGADIKSAWVAKCPPKCPPFSRWKDWRTGNPGSVLCPPPLFMSPCQG